MINSFFHDILVLQCQHFVSFCYPSKSNIAGTTALRVTEQWRAMTDCDLASQVMVKGHVEGKMLSGNQQHPAAEPQIASVARHSSPAVLVEINIASKIRHI